MRQPADQHEISFGDAILNREAVAYLLAHLEPEEREILLLREVEDLSYEEIGRIIGMKYRNPPHDLKGSTMRYHNGRIIERLKAMRAELGL
jgi:hypothetical protein